MSRPRHNRWAGIGPAVDTHLDRWNHASRAHTLYGDILNNAYTQADVDRIMNDDLLQTWIAFGRTYGVVGTDGNPIRGPHLIIPRDDGTAPGDIAAVEGDVIDESRMDVRTLEEWVTVDGQTIGGREQFDTDEYAFRHGVMLADRERMMLDAATSHYISAEVTDEVTTAAALAEPEPLFDTDIFTPVGFAILEHPLLLPDLDPDTGLVRDDLHVPIRAIGWHRHDGIVNLRAGTRGPGVSLFLYTTADDYNAVYIPEMHAAGFTDALPSEREPHELLPIELIPWAFGVDWMPRDDVRFVAGTVPSSVGFLRRWFLSLMRLMWQEIIVRRHHHPHRAEARRWERLARRKELLDYSVLRLRRIVDPGYLPESIGLPLDHRVKVRAHWRRQHYPSLGPARFADGRMNPDSHRLIWIEEHWKGPEDAPFGPFHKATSVSR